MKPIKRISFILAFAFTLSGCTEVIPEIPSFTEQQLTYIDEKANSYKVGDVFDNYVNNGGLETTLVYSNGVTLKLEKPQYKRTIYFGNNILSAAEAFVEQGNYTVNLHRDNVPEVNYQIKVGAADVVDPPAPEPVRVTGISINSSKLALTVGDETTLTATVYPENADNKNFSWSFEANPSGCISLDNGKISAISEGNATVTVTTEDGNFTASCSITVQKKVVNVTSVSLNKSSLTIEEKQSEKLVAKVLPDDADNKTITWGTINCEPAGCVSVDSDGTVHGVVPGTGTVVVTTEDGKKTDSCTVVVTRKPIYVTSVSLNETSIELIEGDEKQLTATIEPSNADDTSVTWASSDEEVATVSAGKVKAIKEGNATITVTTNDGKKTATCAVSVSRKVISVNSVSLNKATLSLNENESETLVATIDPENADNKKVSWLISSAKPTGCVSVDQTGKVTAVSQGVATVTVKTEDGNKTASCAVSVNRNIISVSGVSLNKNGLSLTEGDEEKLTATVQPTDADNKEIKWSIKDDSPTGCVSVDNDGNVKALAAGSATVVVKTTDGGFTAECIITVAKKIISVTGLDLDKTNIVLEEGETDKIIAKVLPENADNKSVTFESNKTSVATVDANGNVTAVAEGEARISVTTVDGGFTKTCTVTVNKKAPVVVNVTSVSIDKTTLELDEGATANLTAKVEPSNATNQKITWSTSNSNVATVNEGKVTAVKAGKATITATSEDGNKAASCEVTVKEVITTISVESVSFEKTSLTLEIDETTTLAYAVLPENATDKSVTFSTDKAGIVEINNNSVKALKAGTVVVTVKTTDGNKTDTCSITVNEPVVPITGDVYTMCKDASILASGDKIVIGCSSKSVAAGSLSGEYLIAESGVSFSDDKSEVTVPSETAQVFELIKYGSKWKLKTSDGYLSSNSSNKLSYADTNNTWEISISTAGVATIAASSGKLLYNTQSPRFKTYSNSSTDLLSPNIYRIAGDGTTPDEEVKATSIDINPSSVSLEVDETSQISATVYPDDAAIKTVTWSSSNESVATVDANGLVTAVSAGTANIVATSNSDSSITNTCVVTVKEKTVIDGENKVIKFKTNSSDGSSTLSTTTYRDQISSGSDFVKSANTVSYVFAGKDGLKIGSNSYGGTFDFNVVDDIKELDTTKIIIETAGSSSNPVKVSVNGTSLEEGTAGTDYVYTPTSPISLNKIKIASNKGKKFYIVSIKIICKPTEPIDPTGISIPSSVALATGEEKTLDVTYSPSDCNQNKDVTWTSSNESIVSVSNGKIKGIKAGTATITATSTFNSSFTSSCEVTVSDVAVTSVTLSKSTLSLGVGKTTSLTATVSPSNATNKDITWNSDNVSVASVANGVITANSVGSAVISATAGSKTATCAVTVTEASTYDDKWTILIYMCGSDLESSYADAIIDGEATTGCATEDLEEIDSVTGQPDDVNIVVEAGGASKWDDNYSFLTNKKLNRFHLDKSTGTFESDASITKASMGESSTLQSFLEWGIKTYPAENIGLIFWNHGGAMDGVCFDENYSDDSLTNYEIQTAIRAAKTSTDYTNNFAFIGYDACLMDVQDYASFNSEYADYTIAAQESEWGYGWSYEKWIGKVYSKSSTETILKAAVDGFYSDTSEAYTSWGETNDQTLAYYSLENWAAYETAFENFASTVATGISSKEYTWSKLTTVINKAQKFGYSSDYTGYNGGYVFDVFDVGSVISKIKADSTLKNNSALITSVNALSTAYSNLGIYEKHGSGSSGATGLSLFCPISGINYKSCYDSTQTNFTNWQTLCVSNGNWYR